MQGCKDFPIYLYKNLMLCPACNVKNKLQILLSVNKDEYKNLKFGCETSDNLISVHVQLDVE